MRVAIFSDVHGNLTALNAVLEDIESKQVNLTIFAGDLCTDGAQPQACVERLRESNVAAIAGNTDQRLCNQPLLSDEPALEEAERIKQIENNTDWTWAQLDEMNRAWLRNLPLHRRFSPTVHPKDDLLVVHANPIDTDYHILPSPARQRALYDEVRQPDDDPELEKRLGHLGGGIVAFGHLHIPGVRDWHDLQLVNISSVSLPLDGDLRAKYGLLTWESGSWTIEHQYVPYDVDQEIALLRELQPPSWQKLVQRLETAVA